MGSEILIKIFIIFSLLSLDRSHIVISNALSNDDAAGDYYLSLYHHMEESGNGNGKNQNQVHRVSGEDEHDQKQAVLLKKFRALLGLRRFKAKSPLTYDSHHVSPSPSPSPSIEAETTVPALPPSPPRFLHAHHHHWPPQSSPARPHHNTDKRGVKRRMLVTILVSVGAAAFLACAIGFIFFCFRFKKNRKSMWVFRKRGRARGKSKYVNSSKSTRSKVNSSNNSGMDLFYLNSLGIDLEQQSSCIKQMNESVNTSSVNNNNNNNNNNTLRYVLNEREDENEEVTKSKSDNGSSSSTREIMPVHHEDDDAGSVKYESDDGGEKIEAVPVECRSSDDESFHSFGDSCSSNDRLSNASVGSNLSDKPENFSPIEANTSPSIETLNSQKETHSSPPPPPPPPPPPVPPPVRPPRSASCSVQFVNKASSSPALPDSSSPANSESSSQSSKPQESPPSIPPPPCPPPPRSNNAVKGPPPPPSLFAPSTPPLGKDGAPLPKLKPLHWDKVRAAPDRTMVWDKIRSNSFELDEEMIESLFGYNIQNSMKNDESKSKTPSPSKHVLEPKRLQNITILSKALNVTTEQVCDSLIKGEGLSLQQLEALVKMVPTKEEESKLFSYKGDINELGSAEKFVRGILSIPFAFQRVEAMLYRETFEDEVIHLRNSFSMLEEACKELRSSRLFLKLLEAVLKTGNRMNIGTIRGGARAFKLDALLKLADVKGTDGKTTLLHFVVLEIIRSEGIRVSDSIMGKINQRNTNKNRNNNKTDEEREEGYRRLGLELVSGLSSELYNVKKTATIDLDVLASSVSNLSQGLSGIQQLLNDDDDSSMGDEKNGNFEKSMKLFVNYAKKKLKEVQEDERKVLLLVKEITEYFHGDVSKEEGNLLRIFVIVRDFLGMLDHVCKELRSLKVPTSPNPLAPFR